MTTYTIERSTAASRTALWAAAVCIVLLYSMPWWATASQMRAAIEIICFVVIAQMWNLMAGYGGMISVGQQAFVGLGGYALFLFAQHLKIHPFLAWPLAGLTTALVAIPLAKMVFRMRGGYFAIGTWVVAEALRIAISNIQLLGAGSGQSLTVMVRVPQPFRSDMTLWLACTLLLGCLAGIYFLLRSRFGLGLTALRDSEAAAASQGVAVDRLKLQVYVLSALGTGLAGALYYLSALRISPGAGFDITWVVAATFIVVIGGIGTLEGPLIGAAVFFGLRWLLADYGVWYWLVLGGCAIGVMVMFPKGVWGYVQHRYQWHLFPVQYRIKIK
jgi:branched-chain amino acid transport system permease protein